MLESAGFFSSYKHQVDTKSRVTSQDGSPVLILNDCMQIEWLFLKMVFLHFGREITYQCDQINTNVLDMLDEHVQTVFDTAILSECCFSGNRLLAICF